MNPAVRRNAFLQAVAVGRFELCKRSVFENERNYRIIGCKTFKHVGIGRISRFCFFLCRQSELFKKDCAELLWRIYIEFLACKVINLADQGVDFFFKHRSVLLNALTVNKKSRNLH